ncbi:hypothetical protein CAI21_21285 [Alkalilimnicola ehrlichii]|uniref:Uncharacterized protein n=1 Tax=Alkalilimnicola ehrlichii TaxID=351052 RepID=A0A3E0WGR1_9GAMM|nr:hypothetical protein [Alkalilimnicola ehrlichii]RFA24526.1 hypothetical protein CAI21_21285 [Alkalilimnicola ehrlichii]RFA32170.1 hypothetical protein CAL65_20330 [Alkalilimnicola ehrlichii]
MPTHYRLSSLFLAAALSGGLVGCGSSSDSNPSHTNDPEDDPSVVFAYPRLDLDEPLSSPFPGNHLFVDKHGHVAQTVTLGYGEDELEAMPYAKRNLVNALNSLHGFSTNAPLTVRFNRPIEHDSAIAGRTVQVYKLDSADHLNARNTAEPLSADDFTVEVVDMGRGSTLKITPKRLLKPGQLYTIVLTRYTQDDDNGLPNGLTYTDSEGKRHAVRPSATYESLINGSDLSDPRRIELRQHTLAAFNALEGFVTAEETVLSWNVYTQPVESTLNQLHTEINTRAGAQALNLRVLAPAEIGSAPGTGALDAGDFLALPGSIELPLYHGVPNILGRPGIPATSESAASHNALNTGWETTLLQPLPEANRSAPRTPVLMTAPNGFCDSGKGPWPVVIYQHGIGGDRTELLNIAPELAQAGMVGLAIDLPLHGPILDSLGDNSLKRQLHTETLYYNVNHPLRSGGELSERNFYLPNDLWGGNMPDTTTEEAPSGEYFVNFESLHTFRDNIRQASADLFALTAALRQQNAISFTRATPCANGHTPRFDAGNIYFLGHSFGAVAGMSYLSIDNSRESGNQRLKGASLGNLTGGLAESLWASEVYRPRIEAALDALGYEPDTWEYERYFIIAQTVLDSADPINYAELPHNISLSGAIPLHLQNVKGGGNSDLDANPADQVLPFAIEGSTFAGADKLLEHLKAGRTRPGGSAPVHDTRFLFGGHDSFINPAARVLNADGDWVEATRAADVTGTMQQQALSFITSGQPSGGDSSLFETVDD